MQLIAWLAICVIAASILRERPVATLGLVLALRLGIPSVAASAITGDSNAVQLHPASYFLIVAFVVACFSRGRSLALELGRMFFFYVTLLFVFIFALTITLSFRGPQSVTLLTDTLGMGIILLVLTRAAIAERHDDGRRLAVVFVGLAAAESTVVLAQWATSDTLVWKTYMTNYWWYSPTGTTVTGTIGAWLDIGMFLAVAVPLAASIKRPLFRFSLSIILILAILATERRTPLVVALLGLAYLLFVSKLPLWSRFLSLVTLSGGAALVLSSDLLAGVIGRFENDTVSAQVRNEAFDYFATNISKQAWYGSGFGSNGAVTGLQSSFENGYIMYAWDFGLVATVVLFGALGSLWIVAMVRRPLVPGALTALAFAFILVGTYSGLQTQGPCSWILLYVGGLCVARSARELSSEEAAPAPARRRSQISASRK